MILTSAHSNDLRGREESVWRNRGLLGLVALSAYSTAIGWQAQLVSYPLYRAVGAADFPAYHRAYNAAIPAVVIAPGFATFLASIAFIRTRPASVPHPAAAIVAASGAISLLSTVLWAIPMHIKLDRLGRSQQTIDRLLDANLVRSLSLTVGTSTLLWCAARARRER